MSDINGNDNLDNSANLLVLSDEEGNEYEFEVVDTLEHNDTIYFALVPTDEAVVDELEQESGSLVILKNEMDEESGEEFLGIIESDDEYDEVSDLFIARLKEYYDFE